MNSKRFEQLQVLDELIATLPAEDIEGLTKYWEGTLPEPWGIGEQAALLIVDMTRGFVEDRFPMGWAKTGEPCKHEIGRLLTLARAIQIPVFFTKGFVPSVNTERGAWLRGRDTPKGADPREQEIVEALAPGPGEHVVVKAKPSAFFGTQLFSMLNYLRVDTVIITGMTTSGCVRATVNDAFMMNYRVIVPIECVADRSQLSHRVELVDMGVKYADLVHLDELMVELADAHGVASVHPGSTPPGP